MTGSLQMEATRGGGARLSGLLDVLPNENVTAHASLDFLTNENVRTHATQPHFCNSSAAEQRASETHFLPAGNLIRKPSFSFLPVVNGVRISLTIDT